MKLNKRILNNLFKFKNKKYKSDIENISVDVDTFILSAYPASSDENVIKVTPIILGFAFPLENASSRIMKEYIIFKNTLCKMNMKYVEDIKDNEVVIVISGLPYQYDNLVTLITSSIDKYECNSFITFVKEIISIFKEGLFPQSEEEFRLSCVDGYESTYKMITNCNSIGIVYENEPSAMSILCMQKIDKNELKNIGLNQKDVLSLCNMVFIVRGDIAENYLFDKAVYLFDLSEINALNGYFLCSMSIYDFMTSDLINDPEINEIVNTYNTEYFKKYFSVCELDENDNVNEYNIFKERIKLELVSSKKQIEFVNNDVFYEDIDEDIEEDE